MGRAPTSCSRTPTATLPWPVAFGGAFFNQGQACVAGSRLFVQESIADEFTADLSEKAKNVKLGQGLDSETEMGPLVSAAHRESVAGHIEAARDAGASITAGGEYAQVDGLENGLFLQPTVIDQVTNDMQAAQEEIFGPVVSVIRFNDFDHIVEMANDVKYGLSAGVWSFGRQQGTETRQRDRCRDGMDQHVRDVRRGSAIRGP